MSTSSASQLRESTVEPDAVLTLVRQLATKLKAELSLDKSLAALSSDRRSSRALRDVCTAMQDSVSRGVSLSAVMREHGCVFDDCVVRLVEIGEETGNVKAALSTAAEYLGRLADRRRRLRNAFSKPLDLFALVLLAVFAAVVTLSFLVKEALPPITSLHLGGLSLADKIAISVAHGVRSAWPFVALLGLLGFLALHILPRLPRVRAVLDSLALEIPILCGAVQAASLASLADTVSFLMLAGCLMDEAMTIAAQTAGNQTVRKVILRTIAEIEGGKPYLDAWVERGLLRRRDVAAAQTAERRGQLQDFFKGLAADYQSQAAEQIGTLKAFVHTGVVLSLGLIIVAVVLTLYVPTFIAR